MCICPYQPSGGRPTSLKAELTRALEESNDEKFRRLMEKEEIGDRKPSKFYHDFKRLAGPLASAKFILTLWKNRLPTRIRCFLAGVDGDDVARMLRIADEVHEDLRGRPARTSFGDRCRAAGTTRDNKRTLTFRRQRSERTNISTASGNAHVEARASS